MQLRETTSSRAHLDQTGLPIGREIETAVTSHEYRAVTLLVQADQERLAKVTGGVGGRDTKWTHLRLSCTALKRRMGGTVRVIGDTVRVIGVTARVIGDS
jgi:hypothetical protein